MNRDAFESASGLRPASAYLMIGIALLIVCGKSWVLALEEDHHQPRGTQKEEQLPAPDFDIVDRDRHSLALSVQRMSLRLSPRSMWQAHTPADIAVSLAELLDDGTTPGQLIEAFFPSARAGVIRVEDKEWRLTYEEADRIEDWAYELGIGEMLWLVRAKDRAEWRIHWRPVELLSSETRRRQNSGKDGLAPITWSRRLADGLAKARTPQVAEGARPLTHREIERRRSSIWRVLIPCADTIAIDELPPERVLDLIELLDEEFIQKQQMNIEFAHDRVYPVRAGIEADAAWGVLGSWRYIDEAEANRLAAQEEGDEDEHARLARKLLDVKHPRSGLEGVAASLLGSKDFEFIAPAPASYRYRKSVPVHQKSRRYFYGDAPEGPTPQVFATLDSELQEYLHGTLRTAVDDFRAAAAMGIVVDVETGDVLAVDGCSAYEVSEFLPTWHLFSPGSTFKVVVMATALDAGVVDPNDEFDTYNGHYNVPGSSRVIREAEGAPTGRIPTWKAISRSVNAVMVQIGMKIPARHLRSKLIELGYNQEADVGVGQQRAGHLRELPWKPAYTHASVSFGHELSVNLWQHATALATILRGGVRRPLRMISGIEWGDDHYRLLLAQGEPVFSQWACASVREMMAEGARTGTGRHIAKRERDLGTPIELLSKTGTTEKEPGVPCLHLELERNEFNSKLPGGRHDPNFVTFDQMKRRDIPHKGSCYTSSICLAGRVFGESREIMVLMVVDEPRSKLKFGSDVAGPAAASVLKEALGLTKGGVSLAERSSFEQSYGYDEVLETRDHPWLLRAPVEPLDEEPSW